MKLKTLFKIIIINLITDLVYAKLDPRIKLWKTEKQIINM